MLQDSHPSISLADLRRDGLKTNARHVLRLRQGVPEEELHEWRPVDALITPPMPGTKLLVVRKVWVADGSELLEHFARLAHRDIVIGTPVQDVDALLQVVLLDTQRVTGAPGTQKHRCSRATVGARGCAARCGRSYVTTKAHPAGAWRDGSEFTGKVRAQLPCSVAAHGMTSQPTAARIVHDRGTRVCNCFREVNASPVFPVKAEGSTIGWADNMRFLLWRIRGGLPGGFDASTVNAEEDAWLWISNRTVRSTSGSRHHGGGRHHGVVLRASIDRAHARDNAAIT